MSHRPRLLLVPSFTELEWGIVPQLEEWAEVVTFDPPGVGSEPLPDGIDRGGEFGADELGALRDATADRALAEADDRGWARYVVVADSYGHPAGVRTAARHPERVLGLAMGHAGLSHDRHGDRAPVNTATWEAMSQLLKQDRVAFIRHGISQMTRGAVDDELAAKWVERFPSVEFMARQWEAMGDEPEPIGDEVAALDVPLLLAKHEGCLGRTDEGYEDIVARFPQARTVSCPEACADSPAFAQALRDFCTGVGAGSAESDEIESPQRSIGA